MLGKAPKGIEPPKLESAKNLRLKNAPDLPFKIANLPDDTYIVEECRNFKVLIKKPNGLLDLKKAKDEKNKTRREKVLNFFQNEGTTNPSDFTVWVVEPNGEKWMPRHMKTLTVCYKSEKSKWEIIYEAIKDVILNYKEPKELIDERKLYDITITSNDGRTYPLELILSYLKWMAVLEDTLYPPGLGYLGRKLAFAGYALVGSGLYEPKELRLILRAFG